MISLRNLPIRQKVSVIIMLTSASALVLACGAFVCHHVDAALWFAFSS